MKCHYYVKVFHGQKWVLYVKCRYSLMLQLKMFSPCPYPSTTWAFLFDLYLISLMLCANLLVICCICYYNILHVCLIKGPIHLLYSFIETVIFFVSNTTVLFNLLPYFIKKFGQCNKLFNSPAMIKSLNLVVMWRFPRGRDNLIVPAIQDKSWFRLAKRCKRLLKIVTLLKGKPLVRFHIVYTWWETCLWSFHCLSIISISWSVNSTILLLSWPEVKSTVADSCFCWHH